MPAIRSRHASPKPVPRDVRPSGVCDDVPPIDEPVFVDEQPVLEHLPEADYPEMEIPNEEYVTIRAFVAADGLICETQIVGSSGILLLDELATGAVMRARFRPALRNGAPVGVWVQIPMHIRR